MGTFYKKISGSSFLIFEWIKFTGMVSGVVGGCAAGMCVWLSYASQYPGGLSAATFVKNTGEEYPMLGMILNKMSTLDFKL